MDDCKASKKYAGRQAGRLELGRERRGLYCLTKISFVLELVVEKYWKTKQDINPSILSLESNLFVCQARVFSDED